MLRGHVVRNIVSSSLLYGVPDDHDNRTLDHREAEAGEPDRQGPQQVR